VVLGLHGEPGRQKGEVLLAHKAGATGACPAPARTPPLRILNFVRSHRDSTGGANVRFRLVESAVEKGMCHAILIAMIAILSRGVFKATAAGPALSKRRFRPPPPFTSVRGSDPAVGYVTGWSMVMDYLLTPLICTVWCAYRPSFAPGVPPWIWKIFFVIVFTFLECGRGIKTSVRINTGMAFLWGLGVVGHLHRGGARYFGVPHDVGLLHAAFL